jgi:glycosyltransferase involved in cell wall biosynthesis
MAVPGLELVGIRAFHRGSVDAMLFGAGTSGGGTRPQLAPSMAWRTVPLPRPVLYEMWARVGWPKVGRDLDLVHSTTVVAAPSRRPSVVTIHDLAFMHEGGHTHSRGARLFTRALARVRRHADLVLCSSTATMDDCEQAGIGRDRLRLVMLGTDARPASADAIRAARIRHGIAGSYLLSVGTAEPRKNLARLVEAFSLYRTTPPGAQHGLVIVGPSGWGDSGLESIGSGSPVVGIKFLGEVPADDLAALYSGADALVYPSLREGFGLPVLEAMGHGTAVVTSRGTATEEVAGGAAVLVDPLNSTDIARGIDEAVAARTSLIAAGTTRAGALTWHSTADSTLAAYRELV